MPLNAALSALPLLTIGIPHMLLPDSVFKSSSSMSLLCSSSMSALGEYVEVLPAMGGGGVCGDTTGCSGGLEGDVSCWLEGGTQRHLNPLELKLQGTNPSLIYLHKYESYTQSTNGLNLVLYLLQGCD